MADYEKLLIAKVVRDGNLAALLEARVNDDFFVDAEHLRVLAFVREHFREHGTTPAEETVAAEFPSWKFPKTPEPLAFYLERVRSGYTDETVARAVQEAAQYLEDGEGPEALRTLQLALSEVSAAVSPLKDHNLTDPEAFDRLYDFYASLTDNPDALRGYETGWPTIDMATMGLQKKQLITLVGPPKGGKSTIVLSMASHINQLGFKVLLISFEMSYDEQVARWVGIRARLNYRRLLKGKMNDFDERRMQRLLKQLRKGEEQFVLSEDISSTTTVSGIIAKLQQHQPDVVFVDGVYLLDDENGEPKGSSQAITNITRSLKRVAQVFDIPVVISTQTLLSKMRGSTIKASSIGYSSSFGQDSDTVIAVEPRENEHEEKEHWLKVLYSRSGPLVETQIDFDWHTSTFTEFASDWADLDDPDEEDDGEMRSA